ncbi:hypothetical protein BURCENBC7_AP1125 [Burkholderia cenocepacia BC7]|nr:hypothetical protein BURCENK562V_C0964 [Burkholderia cenocepacia K56-2Valvano]ERI32411.1 hypothetical protein BURCENBC7_AP1125 [Burkholderia cenocepacia BC7]
MGLSGLPVRDHGAARLPRRRAHHLGTSLKPIPNRYDNSLFYR